MNNIIIVCLFVIISLVASDTNISVTEICDSDYCKHDAERFLLAGDLTSDPCDNIMKFSCDKLQKNETIEERFKSIQIEIISFSKNRFDERSKLLETNSQGSDLKIFKIAKKFYQRCLNSSEEELMELIERNADPRILKQVHWKNIGFYQAKSYFEAYSYWAKNRKNLERFEQCIDMLEDTMEVVLKSMVARHIGDKKIKASAESLIKRGVQEMIEDFESQKIPEDIKKLYVDRMKSIQYVVGYPPELLNDEYINKLYNHLELSEDDNITETFKKMQQHHVKMKNSFDPLSYGDTQNTTDPNLAHRMILDLLIFRHFDKISLCDYLSDDNILYCMPDLLKFPYFHQDRSHLVNSATILPKLLDTIKFGLLPYSLSSSTKPDPEVIRLFRKGFKDGQTLAYNSYLNWEKTNPQEPSLPGIMLSNHQLFWLAVGNSYCTMNMEGSSYISRFVEIKLNPVFDELFGCPPLKIEEEKLN